MVTSRETRSSEHEPDTAADLQFESFARKAGASLRSPAPDDGIGAIVRQGNRQRNKRLAIEIAVVAAVVVTGVAVFKQAKRTEPIVNFPPLPATTVAPQTPTSIASASEMNQWFLDYTGNPAGPASGQPVKFGIAMPSFTDRYDLDLAATYLNEHAGGVGGRQIVLDICAQALAVCADRFAADPAVVAVLENQWSGDSIGAALAGRKPLHTAYSGNGTTGVGYYPTYGETVNAMALQARKLTVPAAKILVIDAAVTQHDLNDPSVSAYVTPDLSSSVANRDVVTVKALNDEHLAVTIRRAEATDAAAVILATPPIDYTYVVHPHASLVCDDLFASLAELGMKAVVIVVDGCEPRDGWYQVDVGYNTTSPDLQSGALPINEMMPGLGWVEASDSARGIREVGALLAVIRIINQLGGPAAATPAALDQAMRDFTGPLPLGAGPLDCSPPGQVAVRAQPGSCVRFVDVHQFVHDTWIDLAPIDLGA